MTETETIERATFIQGLRELADYLAAHPLIPVTKHSLNEFVDTREEWDAIRATDPAIDARASGSFLCLRKTFAGGVKLEVNTDRPEDEYDADVEAPDVPM